MGGRTAFVQKIGRLELGGHINILSLTKT